MKPIKFKVWCEFEIDGEIQTSMESPASWFLLTQGGKLWSYDPITSPKPLEKEYKKAIPLFYTGIKDKNGKEVYEGDIFQFGTKKEWEKGDGERGIVRWHERLARFGLDFYSIYGMEGHTGKTQHLVELIDGLKIIGNIYENPNLLEEE